MNTTFIEFNSQISIPTRSLYVDLMRDKDVIIEDINLLIKKLQMMIANDHVIRPTKKPIPVSRASDKAIQERIDELKRYPVKFQTTQLAISYSETEIIQSIEGLAIRLENAGVHLIQPGVIVINDLCKLEYDQNGCITRSNPDIGLCGINALELIAGVCAQDFGLVIERNTKLIYLYGSARYEKTPKHVESGFDYFVGEDFLEWHRRIPHWGATLAIFFELMYLAFKQNKLDSLIVDLKGRNLYTDGKIVVRRYERDYALTLPTMEGDTIGIIVFADSLFKNNNDEIHPFFGGKHVEIKSPREFSNNFHLVTHAAFQHHPFGIRDESGALLLEPC